MSSPPCPELDTTNDSALDASFTIDTEPDLIIIDFEYCAYNYRGYDLANHFIEWTFDYTNPQFPYFYHNTNNCATVSQRRDFIVNYLKKYHDDDNYNPTGQELEKVDGEIQFFTMLSHLFWSLWSVINVTSAIEFGYWVSFFFIWLPLNGTIRPNDNLVNIHEIPFLFFILGIWHCSNSGISKIKGGLLGK